MKSGREISTLLGRAVLAATAVSLAAWTWRLWGGIGKWNAEFRHPLPDEEFLRYLIAPFAPLLVAVAGLLALALNPWNKSEQRLCAVTILLAIFGSALTPGGFSHDMGHTVLGECSSRLGVIHTAICTALGALMIGWMILTPTADSTGAKTVAKPTTGSSPKDSDRQE